MSKSKAYRIATNLIHDTKYFYLSTLDGLILALPHYNISITEDSIADVKDAIIDHFCDGVEPEWEKESHWNYWEAISPDWFEDGLCLKRLSDFES